MRFDLFTALRLNISRNKAAELIKSGKILLNGQICVKPSFEVGEFGGFESSDEVNLGCDECGFSGEATGGGANLSDAKTAYKKTDEKNLNESGVNLTAFLKTKLEKGDREDKNLKANSAKIELVGEIYVGRGALKLKSFLATCALDARGKNALDVGSSTGGFVQILLQNGVASVTALDVGSSQLDASLRADSRVIVAENTDVREFAANFSSPSDAGKFDGSAQNLKAKFEPSKSGQTSGKFELSKSNLTEPNLKLKNANLARADAQRVFSKSTQPCIAQNTQENGEFDSRDAAREQQNLSHAQSNFSKGTQSNSPQNIRPNLPQNARPSAVQIARESTKSDPSDAEKEKKKFDLITCDVSFISLREILPSIDVLAGANCDIIVLFKPQFEVGRAAKRNKKGVVIDAKAVREARAKFELAAANLGWVLKQSAQCEVKGKEGNAEFFYAFNKR